MGGVALTILDEVGGHIVEARPLGCDGGGAEACEEVEHDERRAEMIPCVARVEG